MRWLVRRVHRKGKGQLSYEEDVHYGDTLTIGRGADQAIFLTDLRAALHHARVTVSGRGKYRVESLIVAGIRVNGGIVQQATLGPGATIEIGATRIELVEPPEDFEGAVDVSVIERGEQEDQARQQSLPTTLRETWLGKRSGSWLLASLILLLFLALPIAAHYLPSVDSLLRSTPLPSRAAWEAGELASAHHFFGQQCGTCHGAEPFKWVRDETCLSCHGAIAAHADPARFDLPQLGEARCAHCHRDHNGPDGLVRNDQALCTSCHVGLSEHVAAVATRAPNTATDPTARAAGTATDSGPASAASNLPASDDSAVATAAASGRAATPALPDVGDFGSAHPEFRVTLADWDANGAYAPRRVDLGSTDLAERSGLSFPHDVHLASAGVRAPDGGARVLQCASCHAPEPGGAKMQPVDFETMCQDCHRLTFDVTEPTRQVPHGKVAEILFMLDEFYARRALEGEIKDPTAPPNVRARRRPGQPVTREIRQEALTWARDKARRVGESLFTGTACSQCHTVSAGSDAATEPGSAWTIAPVRVAGEWFPKAHFTHARHATMQCTDCHAATTSTSSRDVLLPGIADCRTCHAGADGGDNRLSSTCTACHGYHESGELLLKDL